MLLSDASGFSRLLVEKFGKKHKLFDSEQAIRFPHLLFKVLAARLDLNVN